jgi:tRNA threonylcarbamoyladenosine biosynthesis protein TsaE
MEKIKLRVSSETDTISLGKFLGAEARPGDIITLEGTLGAGKTFLTQAIGKGLEVPDSCYITSPTFNLLHEYPGRLPLYHMDLYRLSEDDIYELGFEDYIYGNGLCVIEWPDRFGEMMPEERLHIEIEMDIKTKKSSERSREIVLTPAGRRWLNQDFSTLIERFKN